MLQQLRLWQCIHQLHLLWPRQLAMQALHQGRLAPAPPHNAQNAPPLGPTALQLIDASKQSRQILVHVMASQGQQVFAGRALHRWALDRDAIGNHLDPIRLHTEGHQLIGHIPADGDQPSGGAGGQTSDISIAAKEILRWRQTINEILAKHSGKTIEQLEKDSDRDYYMSAEEAKEYGLVDEVMSKKPKD